MISIECATQNTRSRAIPERLGFELEGIIRGVEWFDDHYADHAMYGLLRSNYANSKSNPTPNLTTKLPWLDRVCMGSRTLGRQQLIGDASQEVNDCYCPLPPDVSGSVMTL